MFKKILIANRGEIALRIMRTCRKMNIKTVAVYSEADKNMPYVKAADEAYYIGGSSPAESYLNIAKIVQIAKLSGAEAIHPGYGFLSQNYLFALACEETGRDYFWDYGDWYFPQAGIVFIGPSSAIIKAMGNKLNALKLAEKAGVPTLKRSKGAIKRREKESDARYASRVKKIANTIGYPLIVKPQGGGGGIGMKVVASERELIAALDSSRAQAGKAFSIPDIYLEQYLIDASHIEVQILADKSGRILHLFERDCSIQRRKQKIIEESPCVKLDKKQKKRIHSYAVKIVKRARKTLKTPYVGVGTLEFLADDQGNIYFIEMNTRLQVEHGVSEMINDIDLVEWQIRVAAGEVLEFRQRKMKARGHAIEARVYPETWNHGQFIPQIGKIKFTRAPCSANEASEPIRIDSALHVGEEYDIPLDYESLIMKVLCRGENREEACALLAEALKRISLEGARTNLELLESIISADAFRKAIYTTRFFENESIVAQLDAGVTTVRLWNEIGNLCESPMPS